MRTRIVSAFLLFLLLGLAYSRGGGGCFLPGTMVSTPQGGMPIEKVAPGQAVLAFDGSRIVGSFASEIYGVEREFYYEISAGNSVVRATAEHPFYIGGNGFAEASSLRAGDTVYLISEGEMHAEKISKITRIDSQVTAYNLRTKYPNTFFAGSFAVHNKGGCFEGSTEIACEGGSKQISLIGQGDSVLSFTRSGMAVPSQVAEKYSVAASEYYEISTESSLVRATAEHPFLTPHGFVEAQALSPGDIVYSLSGSGEMKEERVVSNVLVSRPLEVYNLRVDGAHTFFANGIAVHNKGGGGGGGGSGGKSSPPPNMHYYDCNRQYKDGEAQKQCCGASDSMRLSAGASIARPGYPYCSCKLSGGQAVNSSTFAPGASSCECYNAASGSAMARCPVDPSMFCYAFLLAAGIMLFLKYGQSLLSRRVPPIYHIPLVLAALALGFIVAPLLGAREFYMGIVCMSIPFLFAFILVGNALSKVNPGLLGNGQWSSTASAPQGKVKAKSGKVSELLSFWSKIDAAWGENAIKERAKAVFLRLQDCWGRREYAEMEPLLMPGIYAQHTAQLEAMAGRHEINRMEGLMLLDLEIVLVKRFENKEKDEFTAWFKATARDTIVDDRTGKKIRGDSGMGVFEEFWTFARAGGEWKLREIDQPEEGMHVIGEESFDESATPLMMKTLQERATTGKMDTSVPAIREQGAQLGAPAMGEIKEKGGKIHRMLNFLSQTDRIWDEKKMVEQARTLFILLNTSVEKRNLAKVSPSLAPSLLSAIQANIDEMKMKGMKAQKGNLAVRNVEIVLVNNQNDRKKDSFTAWISGQAQSELVDEKTGKRAGGDSHVRDFEEYYTFMRDGREWKLASIDGGAKGASAVSQENIDEGTSRDMLHWYYTKERAV